MPKMSKAQARRRLEEANSKLFAVYAAIIKGEVNFTGQLNAAAKINNMGIDLLKIIEKMK